MFRIVLAGASLFLFQACESSSSTSPALSDNLSSKDQDSLFEITLPRESLSAQSTPKRAPKSRILPPKPPKKSECASYHPPEDLSVFPAPNEAVLIDKEAVAINLPQVKARIPKPQKKGKVVLRVLVSEEGKYLTHQVLKSTDPKLTEAVESVACKLEFLPASRAGKPIPLWVTVKFEF